MKKKNNFLSIKITRRVFYFRAFFKVVHDLHYPLIFTESLFPTRPGFGGVESFEKKLYFNWTLEGAADTFQIWNIPAHGLCANTAEGYCEVDVKTTEIEITNLVAGEGG